MRFLGDNPIEYGCKCRTNEDAIRRQELKASNKIASLKDQQKWKYLDSRDLLIIKTT